MASQSLWRWFFAVFAAALLAVAALPAPVQSQDDDDEYFEELKRNRKKAKEGDKESDKGGEDEKEKADPDAARATALPTSVAGWLGTIKRKWDSTRESDQPALEESWAKLAEAASGDAAQREKIVKSLQGFKEEEGDNLLKRSLTEARVGVKTLREVLEENRPKALAAIMNPAYTEADGCKLQPQVDEACKPLFAVWNDPVGYAIEHCGLDLATPAKSLDALAEKLGGIDATLAVWPDEAANAEAWLRARGAAEYLDVKGEEYRANAKTLEANDEISDDIVTDESKEHVRVLNDYRMMLGKGAMSINVCLTKAAMGHAKYQKQIGRIAHDVPGHPDGATPQDRCRRAGYAGSVTENCLMGASTPADAVWQWYRAAEHHRNMIGAHSVVGAGHCEGYWVQNFGGGAQGRGPRGR